MNTKFIIFDVGNVIIQADDEITFRILQEYGVLDDNASKFYDNTEYKELAHGNITPESFYRALNQNCERPTAGHRPDGMDGRSPTKQSWREFFEIYA